MKQKDLLKKVEVFGVEVLSDSEIITAITGIEGESLDTVINSVGIRKIILHNGIETTKRKKLILKLLFEFVNRVLQDNKQLMQISSSIAAIDFFKARLMFLEYERFEMLMLNSQNKVIDVHIVSTGTINEAPVYIRNCIKQALIYNANSVIFAHNHPASTLQASSADISLHKALSEAFRTINIKVVDSIIIAGNGGLSFAEKGWL